MNGTLREILDLPEHRSASTSGQAEELCKVFREAMAGLNMQLQLVAAQASRAEYGPLEAQRQKLYEAIQKVLKTPDPANSGKGAEAIEKVKSAIKGVEERAAAVASGAVEAWERWKSSEEEFDLALEQISELVDAGHPKSAALEKLGEATRLRALDRKYAEACTLLEQLKPKIEKLRSESSPSESLSASEKESLWKELAQIEKRLESLLNEYQIAC